MRIVNKDYRLQINETEVQRFLNDYGYRGNVSIRINTVPIFVKNRDGYAYDRQAVVNTFGTYSVRYCNLVLAHELGHVIDFQQRRKEIVMTRLFMFWPTPLIWVWLLLLHFFSPFPAPITITLGAASLFLFAIKIEYPWNKKAEAIAEEYEKEAYRYDMITEKP